MIGMIGNKSMVYFSINCLYLFIFDIFNRHVEWQSNYFWSGWWSQIEKEQKVHFFWKIIYLGSNSLLLKDIDDFLFNI